MELDLCIRFVDPSTRPGQLEQRLGGVEACEAGEESQAEFALHPLGEEAGHVRAQAVPDNVDIGETCAGVLGQQGNQPGCVLAHRPGAGRRLRVVGPGLQVAPVNGEDVVLPHRQVVVSEIGPKSFLCNAPCTLTSMAGRKENLSWFSAAQSTSSDAIREQYREGTVWQLYKGRGWGKNSVPWEFQPCARMMTGWLGWKWEAASDSAVSSIVSCSLGFCLHCNKYQLCELS